MKKIISLFLCFILVFSFAACTQSPQQPAEEPQEEAQTAAVEPADQVKLIAENRDLWLLTDPMQADIAQYAVTDLDENGRLELIATITEGSGQFSTTQFYEVSEDYTKLVQLPYSYGETHSEPDIGWFNSFRCYKGELGNFIVAMDEMRNGYAENYYVQNFLVLREGSVDAMPISYCMVLAEDSNGDGEPEMHAYYYASGEEEEELTSAQFETSVDDFFGYSYDRYVADLEWKRFDEQARDSEVDIPAALDESWKAFGFRKDMDEFNGLFVAPSSYYEELFENGEKADIVYGLESLADYWQLEQIGTELESRIASEDNVEGRLIIGQDNFADFTLNDPADARGEVVLEGMVVTPYESGMGDVPEGEAPEGEAVEGESLPQQPMVTFMTEDGLHRFEAYVGSADGKLYVTWYRFSEEDPGADPEIIFMSFTNGVI